MKQPGGRRVQGHLPSLPSRLAWELQRVCHSSDSRAEKVRWQNSKCLLSSGRTWHLTRRPLPQMRKQRRPGRRLPPCTVVATLLLMRAPQKSCSQKGGCKKNCVSSQPPSVPTGHQKEFRSQHWDLQPTSHIAFWCLPMGRLGLQLQQQVLAARFPVATQVYARLAALPWRNGLISDACGPEHEEELCPSPHHHSGKMMIVPVFLRHNLTSVGGSVPL